MRLAIFDFDGTVLRGNSWQLLFWQLVRSKPLRAPRLVGALAARKAGRSDSRALKESALTVLAEFSPQALSAWSDRFHSEIIRPRLRPAALAEIEQARSAGFERVVATGAFDFVIEPVCRSLGISYEVCTQLDREQGRLTGRISGQECRGAEKLLALQARLAGEAVDWSASRAYSDNADDEPLFRAVGKALFVSDERSVSPPSGATLLHWV